MVTPSRTSRASRAMGDGHPGGVLEDLVLGLGEEVEALVGVGVRFGASAQGIHFGVGHATHDANGA